MIEAESYVLDGIVIDGSLFPFKKVSEIFGGKRPADVDPPVIVPLNREVEKSLWMSPGMWAAFIIQKLHSVDPEIRYFLWDRPVDVYGNTGRPNKRAWVNMTERKLEKGLLNRRFEKIFFRPENVSSIQSKGAAIAELRERYAYVTHYDVNPWVIFGLAKVFPDVQFKLVRTLGSGLFVSDAEMKRFPNIESVGQLSYDQW